MEPVFMILGQSAATAAALALDHDQAVQDVDYAQLRERLLVDKQVLDLPLRARPKAALRLGQLPGVTVDDLQAKLTGPWATSTSIGPFVEFGYQHDNNAEKGRMSARFETKLATGRYEVRLYCSPNPNRATNVPVTVHHAQGRAVVQVNQKRPGTGDVAYAVLGEFEFKEEHAAMVEISNTGTDGHVIIDAVQFVPR
jgi:hypothetical protein